MNNPIASDKLLGLGRFGFLTCILVYFSAERWSLAASYVIGWFAIGQVNFYEIYRIFQDGKVEASPVPIICLILSVLATFCYYISVQDAIVECRNLADRYEVGKQTVITPRICIMVVKSAGPVRET